MLSILEKIIYVNSMLQSAMKHLLQCTKYHRQVTDKHHDLKVFM